MVDQKVGKDAGATTLHNAQLRMLKLILVRRGTLLSSVMTLNPAAQTYKGTAEA